MSTSHGRVTPADCVLILGALAFTVYLIEWQQQPIFTAIATTVAAVAAITVVVVMPKAVHRLAGQLATLNNLMIGLQALGSVPGGGVPGVAPPGAVPSPSPALDGAPVPVTTTVDGQVRP